MAFEFFELKKDEASVDDVKKKYKRLSLRHHPDRNGNSQESVEMMQKINEYYDVLLDHFEGGGEEEHCTDEAAASPTNQSGPFNKFNFDSNKESQYQPQEPMPARPEEPRNEKNKKKRRSTKKSKKQTRREQERDEFVSDEMKQLRKEKQRVQQEARKVQKQHTRKAHRANLHVPSRREEVHKEWKQQAEAFQDARQQHRATPDASPLSGHSVPVPESSLDESLDEATPEREPPAATADAKGSPKKPRNLVMDVCNDEIVFALRRGKIEVAELMWQEKFLKMTQRAKHEISSLRYGKADLNEKDVILLLSKMVKEFVMEPLDDDENTLLLYAINYEAEDMIGLLAEVATQFEFNEELFLEHTNVHGDGPLDFAKLSINNEVERVVKMYTDSATAMREQRKPGYMAREFASRFLHFLKQIDPVATGNTLIAFYLTKSLFDLGYFLSIIVIIMTTIWAHLRDATGDSEDLVFVSNVCGFSAVLKAAPSLGWPATVLIYGSAWRIIAWLNSVAFPVLILPIGFVVLKPKLSIMLIGAPAYIVLWCLIHLCDLGVMLQKPLRHVARSTFVEKYGFFRTVLLLVMCTIVWIVKTLLSLSFVATSDSGEGTEEEFRALGHLHTADGVGGDFVELFSERELSL